MKRILFTLVALPMVLSAGSLSFHRNYMDHAVLQRDQLIGIGGLATPGAEVQLVIESDRPDYPVKYDLSCEADEAGEWEVKAELPAGGPLTITAKSGDEVVSLTDVLVGEVWLCSGQSNMQQPVWGTSPVWRVIDGDYVASQMPAFPHIRHFRTNLITSLDVEQSEPNGEWEVLMPESALHTSAIGYFFARQLYRDLQVPIGIIEANWGGMPIRSFMSRQSFAKLGREDVLIQIDAIIADAKGTDYDNLPKDAQERQAALTKAWEQKLMASESEEDRLAAADWMKPELDDSGWEILAPAVESTAFLGDKAPIGVEWFRTTVEIPDDWAGEELLLSLGAIDEVDTTYFNGVKVGSLGFEVPNFWEIPRKYTIPAGLVKAGRAVVAIREVNSAGASGLFGPLDDWYVARTSSPEVRIPLTNGWLHRLEGKLSKTIGLARPASGAANTPIEQPSLATTLFNSMVAPWRRYGVRGEIWYQGESDCGREPEYYVFQQEMVADRREQWRNDDYAFLWCQLSGFERHCPNDRGPEDFWRDNDPNRDHPWLRFRNMQFALLKVIPNSGMAVTFDHGDAYDIHPHRKEEVGFRLAKEAERLCYGYQGITAGPYYRSHEVVGNQMVLHFDNVGAGLASLDGKPLGCFAIAGADGKYFWADAKIVGDTVVLTAPEVPEPVKASYGAVTYDERLNFGNANGFPASPFYTAKPDWMK
ncbi:MAG: hypothetical protein II943_04455 [Victivallales bacterium]|nr:hypothetical protein [Victivallales bacterium]